MAVTVITSVDGYNRPSTSDVYAAGSYFGFKEGHLLVQVYRGGTTETLGIYAPGSWVSASTDDESVFTDL